MTNEHPFLIQEHSHTHNHNITVKEIKAPTDDSIRLLREMEEKVWANVATKVVHDIEAIDAQFVSLNYNPMQDTQIVIAKINDRVVKTVIPTPQNTRYGYGKAVAEMLAEQILMQMYERQQGIPKHQQRILR